MGNKSNFMSVLGIILASLGLIFLILSILIKADRELFLSLGLASVLVSNLITNIRANKKKNNSEDTNS